jgi:glyoxylase-like metal-dependent hydrolase (beta-lactamase superfamily II)
VADIGRDNIAMSDADMPPALRRPPRLRASASLEYPFTPPSADGLSAVEVAAGILWLRQPMPMALDHINVYLLRDRDAQGDCWTLVDTGLNTRRSREVWEVIAQRHLVGLPIRRLICTHSHYDHSGLADWIGERFGAPMFMTHGEYFLMRGLMGSPPPDPLPASDMLFYRRAGMGEAQVEAMFAELRRDPFMPPVPGSYQRLRDGDRLRIGERDWQVVVGEGHSPEHACLYSASERTAECILISGDQLLPRITSNVLVSSIEPEANPLQLWLASLDRLDRLAPDTLVLPSHERVFRGLHARVEELRAHHRQQFELLRAELARSGAATALELMQVQFPRLRHAADELMALGETLAHLSWLRHEGEVRRVLDDDGCHRFSLAT